MNTGAAQESASLSELDLEIVNALQINPRATWVEVGRTLGVDASTAARRWSALERRGVAWVACQPLFEAGTGLAVIELTAAPGHALEVAGLLARDPQAMTVDVTAGARDLVVTLACRDYTELTWYLLERLATLEHLVSVQSHLVVASFSDASKWRLRALTPGQEHAMRPRRTRPVDAPDPIPEPSDQELVAALSQDGRTTVRALARMTGASESTVRRRMTELLESGLLRLRCELARELTAWPVSMWLFARAAPDRLEDVAGALATIAEVRAVLSTAGPYNLLIAVWLRTVGDGQRLEAHIMRKLPTVEVVDRSVVVRPFKLAGRLLDPRGFAIGTVPLGLHGPTSDPR